MCIEQQFLQFANLRPEPLLLVTGEGLVLAVNRAVEDRLGLASRDLQGRPLADFTAEPAGRLAGYLRACARSRDLVLGALTLKRPGGPPLACRSEGAVYRPRSEDQEALILLCLLPREAAVGQFVALTQQIDSLAREVVRRKQVEEELRRQREWLQVTLTSIGDAVIATDTAGRVVFMNPAAQSLTAWPQEDALRRSVEDVFAILNEETRQAAESPVARVLREGTVVGLANHTVLLRRDGTDRAIDDCAAPIRDDAGHVIGTVLVFHDVTERRRLERDLRQRAEELAAADRRKDNFLSMLAHELRNPLAPIHNSIHLLRQAGGDPLTRAQSLEVLARQARHLTRLVDGLVEATRLVRGQVRLERERLDLARLVATTAGDRRSTLEQAGRTLTVDTPETPVWVLGDPTRLAQVLNNLLDNATRFTDPGGAVIVRLALDRDRRQTALTVRDTGIGIEPELLPGLFQVFAQGDRSLARTRGGLGLGLSVVKGLVDLHGGQVEASSAGLRRGAEFRVRLPVEGELAALAAPPPATGMVGGRLRVLVIEDNQDAADSLRLLLEVLGHEARVAYSGPEGVKAATEFGPDVVISDIGLPGLDGYGVAATLRRDPATARILLIALTGYGTEADRRRSREVGFDHHLVKPAAPEEIQRLIENQFRKQESGVREEPPPLRPDS